MFDERPDLSGSGAGRYAIIERLGEGKHGIVLKAIDQHQSSNGSTKYVAIKKIALRTRKDEVSLHAVREIKVLQCCDHPNIISMLDMYPDLCGYALVFDYLPHTLFTRMRATGSQPLDAATVRWYFGQLLDGIAYMHANRIMHRDIKPANLLIGYDDCLKIADFGLSRIFEAEDALPDDEEQQCYSPQVASRWYRAPELLWGSPMYGPAVDLWACGCVLAEMLRNDPLFSGSTDIEQLAMVIQVLGTPHIDDWPELDTLPDYKKITFPSTVAEPWSEHFPDDTQPAAVRLVATLVMYNPRNRLSAAAARSHEYFEDAIK